jgi:hypothetical protein
MHNAEKHNTKQDSTTHDKIRHMTVSSHANLSAIVLSAALYGQKQLNEENAAADMISSCNSPANKKVPHSGGMHSTHLRKADVPTGS